MFAVFSEKAYPGESISGHMVVTVQGVGGTFADRELFLLGDFDDQAKAERFVGELKSRGHPAGVFYSNPDGRWLHVTGWCPFPGDMGSRARNVMSTSTDK